MARWYDKHQRLRANVERMKDMDKVKRDDLVTGIMILIKENSPTLLDDFVQDFPLDIVRRRWYDDDPYLWLIINGLKYAPTHLRERVTVFLEDEIQKRAPQEQ